MKKIIMTIGALVALDQFIKIIIWNFAKYERFTIIPYVLWFEPVQNTYLKDVYLNVFGLGALLVWSFSKEYRNRYYKTYSVLKWLREGCRLT